VRDGRTGVLVPHGDVAALAQEMLRFARDRSLVERLGRAARDWALELTWDGAADVVEGHLKEMHAALS
jgi:glycosyltransferase involved in cell wall biosynthesis